ncbi:MAG: DUF1684 domain-containing protein [Thermoanaerobaculum sp.]|nr:DUF1684 domain-containing protein [Thermoanaerobaculum sp.]MDW7967443.1 DUF1684 domain-containing protein [Thermoanaerobaculum sp.]
MLRLPIFFLAVAVLSCTPPLPEGERRWREGREEAVRGAMTPEQAATFRGIQFFPYRPEYKVRALLQPLVPPQPLSIAASDGSIRPAHRVGRVEVQLPTGRAVLAVYQLDDIRDRYPDHLFLPFRDALAGKETYGSGRYLDLVRLASGVVELDFNRAYNPDCAFGLTGRCPMTPEENWLPFPVPAGEKLPLGGHP